MVFAHFIVGNTYVRQAVPARLRPCHLYAFLFPQPYTKVDWLADIQKASAAGIDAFALNYGIDPWQPARIADAVRLTSLSCPSLTY
jgi:hypothetical protein